MKTITQILELFNVLSTYIYIFTVNIEPLTLLKELPKEISDIVNDIDLIKLLDEVSTSVNKLNEFLKPKLKLIKKFVKKGKKNKVLKNDIPYADFRIDEKPIIKTKEDEQLSFEDILLNKDIKPIKRKREFNFEGVCPYCSAPSKYIYANNGQGKQCFCKVCENTFSIKVTPSDTTGFYCPHCGHKLEAHHDRNGYVVYHCLNKKCSYYIESKKDAEINPDKYKTSSDQYRFHYHYREFKFNLDEIKKVCEKVECKCDLSRIHFDERILGLILTYYINYGLSSRKVVSILRDIHGIKISHQTVMNYASTVSSIIKNYVDYYPYKLGSTLSGDETYVNVKGKQNYVFFFSDPKSKIITSYDINANRDTKCAVTSIYKCISKYDTLPEDFTIITDGNPIYNAAQLFFEMCDLKFDLHQVVGLKNLTEESKTYRPYKQIEERLNRTYKQNYYGTNGYGTLECANSYMVLYVAFFNFLRRHSSLNFKTPVDDNLFDGLELMPDKWIKLINLASASA